MVRRGVESRVEDRKRKYTGIHKTRHKPAQDGLGNGVEKQSPHSRTPKPRLQRPHPPPLTPLGSSPMWVIGCPCTYIRKCQTTSRSTGHTDDDGTGTGDRWRRLPTLTRPDRRNQSPPPLPAQHAPQWLATSMEIPSSSQWPPARKILAQTLTKVESEPILH